MSLLGDLLAQRHIWATLSLSIGIAILLLLILWRSRFEKMVWILLNGMAVYNVVIGVLHWLHLYGVDTTIAFGLAGWFFLLAVFTASVVFLGNKLRKLRGSGHS